MKLSAFFQHAVYILAIAVLFFYMRDQQDMLERDISFLRTTLQAEDLRVNEQGVAIKQWEDVVSEDRGRLERLITRLDEAPAKK